MGVFLRFLSPATKGTKLKSLLGLSVGYTLVSVISKISPFLLLPIVTAYLTPDEFGRVAMFQATLQFLIPFVGAGVAGVISIEFLQVSKKELSNFILTGFLVIGGLIALLSVGILLAKDTFEVLLGLDAKYLYLLPVTSASIAMIAVYSAMLQMQKRIISFSFVNLGIAVLEFSVTIILVVLVQTGVDGRIDAIVYSSLVILFFVLVQLYRESWYSGELTVTTFKNLLSLGSPLVMYQVGFFVVLLTDRLLLAKLMSFSDVGVYMVGLQIGMVVGLIEASALKAWIPWLFSQLIEEEVDKNTIVHFKMVYLILLVLVTLVVIILGNFALKVLFSEEYIAASQVIPWVAMAFMFMGMYKVFAQYMFFKRLTLNLMWIGVLVAVVNIPLTYYLILLNGMVGAAQSTFVSYFVAFVLSFLLSRRLYSLPYLAVFQNACRTIFRT